ncbi:MAG: branched-chain amino acid ABC transporter permease [Chloroflexota bacterium]
MKLKGIRLKWSYLVIVAAVAALAVVPLFANRYYLDIAIIIGIHTMVTVGLCLLMGYTGQISLGQAAFYGMGAYFSAILSKTYGVSPWAAMFIGAAVTGGFAYSIGIAVLRLRGNYLAMATLALGIIMNIVFTEAASFTGGQDGITGVPYLSVGGLVFDTDRGYYYLVWAFCLAALLVSRNIVSSRTGRALRAIRDSESAAESIGINVLQLKAKVFALSAVYASLAGSLLAHYWAAVGPKPFDFLFSIKVVVMAVVGGLASVWGAIFGTATVKILGDWLHEFGEYQVIAFGLMLMIVIVFMPRGLWVHLRSRVLQWQRRSTRRAES